MNPASHNFWRSDCPSLCSISKQIRAIREEWHPSGQHWIYLVPTNLPQKQPQAKQCWERTAGCARLYACDGLSLEKVLSANGSSMFLARSQSDIHVILSVTPYPRHPTERERTTQVVAHRATVASCLIAIFSDCPLVRIHSPTSPLPEHQQDASEG